MSYEFIDVHCHSEYSCCGEDVTVAGYGDIARTTSKVFALTDHSAHSFFPPDRKWGLWSDEAVELFAGCREAGEQRIRDYLVHVRSVQTGGMLIGTELDIMPDGRVIYPQEMLGGLDVVLGAVHALPTLRHKRPQAEVEDEFRFQVLRFGEIGVNALVHPFRLLLGAGYEADEALVRWTVEVAADTGMALEINSHKQYPDHDVSMVRIALDRGVKLTVGTDAHRWCEFGDFRYHTAILEQAGVDRAVWDDVIWHPSVPALMAAAGG